MTKKCLKCSKSATLGNKEEGIALYCADHKRVDDVNVYVIHCIDCDDKATHSQPENRILEYCKIHAPEGYINITRRRCIYPDCKDGIALYGVTGTDIPMYCHTHNIHDEYVNVVTRTCELCDIQPTYGKPGTTYPQFCVTCAPEGYVNVRDQRCIGVGCTSGRTYAKVGTIYREYCAEHAPKDGTYYDARNRNKLCLHEECEKRASYGPSKGSRAEYCGEHIKPDHTHYVLTHNATCSHCGKQPSYGNPITKVAICCKEHLKEYPDSDYVDVKHKLCEGQDEDGNPCPLRADFGKLFNKKVHCAAHHTQNEYRYNNPKCSGICANGKKCIEPPCYTDKQNNYPIRCETHKLENDRNVVETACQSCGLLYYIKEGNKCNDCESYFVKKHDKLKENAVKLMLEQSGFKFIHDKKVDTGCNKYRPDFVIDFASHIVIVECDENQHKSYACECEQGRMINIFQDFGGIPVTFIRYNPDNYIDHKGQKQDGSHGPNKSRLISAIKSLELHQVNHCLGVIYLCYDGDDGCAKVIELDYENHIKKEILDFQPKQATVSLPLSIYKPKLKIKLKDDIKPKLKIRLKANPNPQISM